MLNIFRSLLSRDNAPTATTGAHVIDPMPDLPLEIHDMIIDVLASEECSLNAYSQSCSAILSLCRRRMFAQVAFTLPRKTPSDYQRFQRFVKILTRSPEIGDFIQKVQLNINDIQPDDEAVLKTILVKVGSIEHLGIATSDLKWSKLLSSPVLGPLMVSLLPLVSSLDLRGIEDFKMADLNCCIRLTKLYLKLRPSQTFSDEEPTPTIITLPPQLQHINIDHLTSNILATGSSEINIPSSVRPRLKSLHATLRAMGAAQLISTYVNGLESFSLKWTFSFIKASRSDFMQLGEALHSNIASLRCLTFILSYNTNHELAMEDIAAFLQSLSTPATNDNAVDNIIITLQTGVASRVERFAGVCGKIDDILSISADWPSLRQVSLAVQLIGRYEEHPQASDTLASLPGRFPRLSASNILQYRFEDDGIR